MYTVIIFQHQSKYQYTTDSFELAIKILRTENQIYATIWRNTDNRMLVQEWK